MSDVRLTHLAGRQANRFSMAQARALGYSAAHVERRVAGGRLRIVEPGVYGFEPVLDDDPGRWMAAVLTAPATVLSHVSAAAAGGFWTRRRLFETVTRPGSGGPCRHGGVLVFRSTTLDGDTTALGSLPVTTPERTLLDLAAHVDDQDLRRAVREAIRLGATSVPRLADALERHRGRRGTRRLAVVAARYSGLPVHRARSGAEVRALEVLRDAGVVAPDLNRVIAGEEADLSWRRARVIVEVDGGPFHLDFGEDARKAAAWAAAGWTVRRISSDDVHERPDRLLALVPPSERR